MSIITDNCEHVNSFVHFLFSAQKHVRFVEKLSVAYVLFYANASILFLQIQKRPGATPGLPYAFFMNFFIAMPNSSIK